MDAIVHRKGCSVWLNHGNRIVAYLDEDDDKRKLNLNYLDNNWDDNWRFLALR